MRFWAVEQLTFYIINIDIWQNVGILDNVVSCTSTNLIKSYIILNKKESYHYERGSL